MPNWNKILSEIHNAGSTHDVVRREYLRKLNEKTNRNVIAYYSGWLQKPGSPHSHLNDADKNGFMTVINGLDRTKGLDIILHTPGGEIAATESIVNYLRKMFGTDIRAIIPQLAMSAGTMIACACKEIIMGKQSSLGPIDPQMGGLPAHGIVEEFKRAYKEIKEDQLKIALWQPIIAKYPPALIGECEKAIQWASEMVAEWLKSGMFKDDPEKEEKAKKAVEELGDHALTKSHSRHLPFEWCEKVLKVSRLENHPDFHGNNAQQEFQDAVLSVHHTFIHTLAHTPAFKIIENHTGVAFVQIAQQFMIAQGPMGTPQTFMPAMLETSDGEK
jgi:hypothetical protein